MTQTQTHPYKLGGRVPFFWGVFFCGERKNLDFFCGGNPKIFYIFFCDHNFPFFFFLKNMGTIKKIKRGAKKIFFTPFLHLFIYISLIGYFLIFFVLYCCLCLYHLLCRKPLPQWPFGTVVPLKCQKKKPSPVPGSSNLHTGNTSPSSHQIPDRYLKRRRRRDISVSRHNRLFFSEEKNKKNFTH